MAAMKTVPQSRTACNSAHAETNAPAPSKIIHQTVVPKRGVVTLAGYGIKICVDRGHLILEDGVGDSRRAGRFARVNHGIRRVVVVGSDGMASFGALRWLADQGAALAMLERDGSVLLTTGPVAASDARLRRAQACAEHSGAAVIIVRELIGEKVSRQGELVRDRLGNPDLAKVIAASCQQLSKANTVQAIRFVEAQGGAAYWAAWRDVEIQFPKSDLPKVPEHWRTFGPRTSPVSGSPRCAANPANAILNYLYAILEAETRLSIAALGLDPGLGLLHVDHAQRDSLACDLMEPMRPIIDAFLLDWITRTPFKRGWFFEERNGVCRLMNPILQVISETSSTWSHEIASLVEWYAEALCATASNSKDLPTPGTRLTRRRWREARGYEDTSPNSTVITPSVCRICGAVISVGKNHCETCAVTVAKDQLVKVRPLAQAAALTEKSRNRRKKTQRRQNEARRAWQPSDLPSWLDNEAYTSQIQPRLARFTRNLIGAALDVSISYASEVRAGTRIPHPRHWQKLAKLVGVTNTG
jgi:CRISPR-associated endonuclease Cas1